VLEPSSGRVNHALSATLRRLARARVAFGALFLLRTTPLGLPLGIGDAVSCVPLLGWPVSGFRGHLSFELPFFVVQLLCLARTLAAAAFAVGYRTRVSGIVAGLCGFAVLSQEPFAFNFTLHLLFLAPIVLAFTDCGSLWAVRPTPARAPASSAWLLCAFMASIYFWAGTYKLRPDWLDGRSLALYQAHAAFSPVLADTLLATNARRAVIASCVALTELSLVPLLLYPRTRAAGVVLGLGLHLAIQLVTSPDVLGVEMAILLLALWPTRQRPSGGAAGA